MKACRVHRFGPPEVIALEEIARPQPGPGEVLVRVAAAGVGPWDGWIRAGKSALPQPLPLTLGSDLSGLIEAVGQGVEAFGVGDPVFGVTNKQFTGAYAEFAVASTAMVARKPGGITHIAAAAVPVIAVTAWQALFDQPGYSAGTPCWSTARQGTLVLSRFNSRGRPGCGLSRRAEPRMSPTSTNLGSTM